MRASAVSADPDGLGRLAVLLDAAAADLEGSFRSLRLLDRGLGPVPTLHGLQATIDWLRREANDVRRRALVAASAGQPWRRHDIAGHLWNLGRAAVTGLRDGVGDVMAGAGSVLAFQWYTVTDPGRAATTVVRTLQGAAAADPMVRNVAYLHELRASGFWPAAQSFVHGTFEQVPSGALAVLVGARSAVPRTASNASYLSSLAPGAAATTRNEVPSLLRLSVPVGVGGFTRVALDPESGRFFVLEAKGDGIATRTTAWSGLGRAERSALEGAGIVDHKGRLREDED